MAILYADRRDRRIKSPISGMSNNYRQLNSPAFAKCARSRDFPRLLLRIASEANPRGWAILSHEFSKLSHRRDQRKKIARCVHINRRRKSLAIFAGDQIRRDRRIKYIAKCVAGFRLFSRRP